MQIPIYLARLLTLVFVLSLSGNGYAQYRFVDGDGWRDLYFNDRPIYRYVTPRYDANDRDATLKPFLHIYGFHDDGFITKGAGGMETHHRGIFFGFVTQLGNFWACNDGCYQQHEKYLPDRESISPDSARMASVADWITKDGKAVARDTREVTARCAAKQVILDFDITLESMVPELELKGDPHHGGFHFRAAEEVQGAATTKPSLRAGLAKYVRPAQSKLMKDDIWSDTPWAACAFAIKGHPYTVVHMDHPQNPRPVLYSTRPYGRFGAFFTSKLVEGKAIRLRYRVVVIDGTPNPDSFEKMYADYVK